MNKYEQVGAQELLSMLNDVELMSVKDTVTKSVIPTNSVRQNKKVLLYFLLNLACRSY
jgi:hypothetical protein